MSGKSYQWIIIASLLQVGLLQQHDDSRYYRESGKNTTHLDTRCLKNALLAGQPICVAYFYKVSGSESIKINTHSQTKSFCHQKIPFKFNIFENLRRFDGILR